MRQKLPRTRRPRRKSAAHGAGTILAAMVVSAFALGGATGISESAAQEAATEVAYIEAVNGRVVGLSGGKPVLLEALDTLSERTRLDLQINSEVRICHLRTHRLLTLRGPARALISADGVAAENGQAIEASTTTCAEPIVSKHQGGLVSRGVASKQ
ncbi:MAG: hypothetical protein QOI46_2669 [Alphaproteobacteria bacterium]|nr:hypothetical protein [Alphaproteobacteria bacterium]